MANKLTGGPQNFEFKSVDKENFAVQVIGYFGNTVDENTKSRNVFLVGERLDTKEKVVLKQSFQCNAKFYNKATDDQQKFAKNNFPYAFAAKEHENEMELAKRIFEENYANFERDKDNKIVFTKNGNIKIENDKIDEKGRLKNNDAFQGIGTDAFKFKQKSLVEPGGIIFVKGCYQDTKLKTSDLLKNEKDEKFKSVYKKNVKLDIINNDGEETCNLKTISSKTPLLTQEQIETLPLYNYSTMERVMNVPSERLNPLYMFDKNMHVENGLIQITPIGEVEHPETKVKSKSCFVKYLDVDNALSFDSWEDFKTKVKDTVDILSKKGNLAGSFIMVRMLTEDGKINVPEPQPKPLAAKQTNDGKGNSKYVLPSSAEYAEELIKHYEEIFKDKRYGFTQEDFKNETLFKNNFSVKAEIIPGKTIYFSKAPTKGTNYGNNLEAFVELQELIKSTNNYSEVANKVKKTPLEAWFKKNLFMENFEIPQNPNNNSYKRNGYIEGFVSFSQNPNLAFGAYLGNIVSKYEPGSLSCAADKEYKKSADPRFICATEYAFKTKNIEPTHPDIENEISKGRVFNKDAPVNPTTLQEIQQVEAQEPINVVDKIAEAENQSLEALNLNNNHDEELDSIVDNIPFDEEPEPSNSSSSPSMG